MNGERVTTFASLASGLHRRTSAESLTAPFLWRDVLIDDSIALQLSSTLLISWQTILFTCRVIKFPLKVTSCVYVYVHTMVLMWKSVEVRRQLWELGAGLLLLPCGF